MARHIEELSLKTTKKGARVWLNNNSSRRAGLVESTPYEILYFENKVIVRVSQEGTRTVVKGDIVDVESKKLAASIPDCERVNVEYKKNEVVITGSYSELKQKERETSLKTRVARKQPVRVGELFAGIGLLSRQIKRGLAKSGVRTSLLFANDYDRHASDVHFNHSELWCNSPENAVIVNEDLFSMDKSLVPTLDVMFISYPCVGFSKQQSTKRDMDIYHKEAGVLFVPTLEVIGRANPSIIVIENSDQYLGSDTDYVMDTVLSKLGYESSSTTLKGTDFGDFEPRLRAAKVYYSSGLSELDLTKMPVNQPENKRVVADLLEPIDNNAPNWKDLSYLSKRNDDNSHGHKFMVCSLDAKKIPSFGAHYGKIQNDSPILEHPFNNTLHRIFTPSEHCNVRYIDGDLKDSLVSIADGSHHLQKNRTNATKAHMLCGNSISPTPFFELGKFIGDWANSQDMTKRSFSAADLFAA